MQQIGSGWVSKLPTGIALGYVQVSVVRSQLSTPREVSDHGQFSEREHRLLLNENVTRSR